MYMNEEHTQEAQKVEGTPFEPHHEKNTGMAIVAYLLFFVPLLTEDKNDPFVKFHVRQGFLVFITAVIASLLNMTIILAPIGMIVFLGVVVLAVLGIVNAAQGKEKKLPILGQFTDKVPF